VGDLISRLTNLLDPSKAFAVSVPGVLAALGLVLFMWPARINDSIVVPNDGVSLLVANGRAEKCTFTSRDLEQPADSTPSSVSRAAVTNQAILEKAKLDFNRCIDAETGRLGAEEAAIKGFESEIAVLEKDRDALQTQYQVYEKSGSNLAGQFRQKYAAASADITKKRSGIANQQQIARERKLNVQLASDYLKVVDERLSDPGRLRPQKSIDDFLSGLANHVIAFALLSLALGLILDPIDRALFGAIFDGLVGKMNSLYTNRFTVWR